MGGVMGSSLMGGGGSRTNKKNNGWNKKRVAIFFDPIKFDPITSSLKDYCKIRTSRPESHEQPSSENAPPDTLRANVTGKRVSDGSESIIAVGRLLLI